MDRILGIVKQRHRSEEEWRGLVAEWKSSGKTRRAWCQDRGITYESLRRWTKRLRDAPRERSLVEITAGRATGAGTVGVRVTRNGDVELYGNLSVELLKGVLRAMHEAYDVH